MKLFLVLNRISHSFALLTREISWSTLEINFIFPHIHVLFSINTGNLVHCMHVLPTTIRVVVGSCPGTYPHGLGFFRGKTRVF